MEHTSRTWKKLMFLHASGNGFTVLGQVKRLGSRRVIYEFIDCGEDHPPEVTAHLFSSCDGLNLKALPCLLIDERFTEVGSPLSTLMIKRCELEFQQLSQAQEKMLWDFLKNDYLERIRGISAARRASAGIRRAPNIGGIEAGSVVSSMRQVEPAVRTNLREPARCRFRPFGGLAPEIQEARSET